MFMGGEPRGDTLPNTVLLHAVSQTQQAIASFPGSTLLHMESLGTRLVSPLNQGSQDSLLYPVSQYFNQLARSQRVLQHQDTQAQ